MKYNKICIMLPTYKRSKTSLPVFINSALETCSNPANICFSFCVNKKDIDTLEYLDSYIFPFGCEYEIIVENSFVPNLAKYFNMLYNQTRFSGSDIVASMLGDDMELKTHGWDIQLLNAISGLDGIGVFYCNDNFIAGGNLCVNLFVTRKFVDATKKPFMCPMFNADMIDYVWHMVGGLTRSLHYSENIVIQHNHDLKKTPEERDETYNRLEPFRQSVRNKFAEANVYASVCAGNLVEAGLVEWK